ncbi:hypothetical protein SESBI_00016 [Sesbania bispinosa]|nr:hypothetical protein SESBI_00016 [Sesbania bispinosa]
MWNFLLTAAVAGSTGFAAKHFLNLRPTSTNTQPCNEDNALPTSPIENANPMVPHNLHESVIKSNSDTQNQVFTFSSSESLRQNGSPSRPKNSTTKKPLLGRRGSKNGIRVAKVELRSIAEDHNHRNAGKRFPFCSKRRKTIKNVAGKTAFCSSKDCSLFDYGVSFGIMCMMAGKSEISELNKTLNETAKVVEELKSELNRRKSACAHEILDSACNIGMKSSKMSGRNDKTNSELKDTDVKIRSLPINDDGECGSSALTEEPNPQVLEMDQLEAELEFEIQKLPGCTIDPHCHEEIRPKLDEFGFDQETPLQVKVPNEGCHATDGWDFNTSQYNGISATELNQKLSQLLIEQQENQIADLESELNLAQSKLQEKEAELQALKDYDETEAHKVTSDRDSNTMDSESKQSVVGMKRPIDSESCALVHTTREVTLNL